MKTIKNLSVLFMALLFAAGVSAQGMAASTGAKAKSSTGAKAATGAKTSTGSKASTGTKSADKVDPSKKGPHGETMYTGPKGGSYYLDKNGKKVYPKK